MVFLFDYVWMALEYINLRRCIKVRGSRGRRNERLVSTGCLCTIELEPCPKRRRPPSSSVAEQPQSRGSRKIIYPSKHIVTSNQQPSTSGKRSHKCGVCPRQRELCYSAPVISNNTPIIETNEIPRKKPRMPQTTPQIPISCETEFQEDKYHLPLFKSDTADDPGPPYYLSNIMDKRNIPQKYYSTLDTVLERESRETIPRDDLSESENVTANSSAVSLESSKSYQTSAASSIRKLFQTNAMCAATKFFDYPEAPPIERTTEIKQICELPEMRGNIHSLEIKRSIEMLEIKRNVEFPNIRTIRGKDLVQKKLQQIPSSSIYQIETFKSNLPSRIPIRPESRATLKGDKIVRKPLSSPGIMGRLQFRPETRISPILDTKPIRLEPEKNKEYDSPRRNSRLDKLKFLRPKSLNKFSTTSRRNPNENTENYLDLVSSGGDTGSLEKYCPVCRSLVKTSSRDSLERKISGLSTTGGSTEFVRPTNFTTYDDIICLCKKSFGPEGS